MNPTPVHILILILFIASPASADVVTLTSGKVYEGEILSLGDYELSFQSGDSFMGIAYRMIESVTPSETEGAPNSRYIEKANGRAGKIQARLEAREEKRADRVRARKVDLYMTSWCPYCRKMEAFLRRNGIRYARHDIEKSASAKGRYRQLGGTGVPVVKVGNRVIHGYDTDAVLRALAAR